MHPLDAGSARVGRPAPAALGSGRSVDPGSATQRLLAYIMKRGPVTTQEAREPGIGEAGSVPKLLSSLVKRGALVRLRDGRWAPPGAAEPP